MIIDHSALLYILNVKRDPPSLRLKKLIKVLSQYSFKVKFLRGKYITISDFLSKHPGQDLASPIEIIPISFQNRELLNSADKLDNMTEDLKDLDRLNTIADILCPAKKVPSPVKRITRRTAKPREVAPIWPLTGAARKPEHVSQPQPIQKQVQPQKHVVDVAEVHAIMEPPEPEVLIESQIPDEVLDQVWHHPTPKDPIHEDTGVLELQQLTIVSPQPKLMILQQPLPQVLPMPRIMPLPDTLPKVPDQPVHFQGLVNSRPLDIKLLGSLPGYDNDMDDEKQPEITTRQPDKTMYRKSKNLMKIKIR